MPHSDALTGISCATWSSSVSLGLWNSSNLSMFGTLRIWIKVRSSRVSKGVSMFQGWLCFKLNKHFLFLWIFPEEGTNKKSLAKIDIEI